MKDCNKLHSENARTNKFLLTLIFMTNSFVVSYVLSNAEDFRYFVQKTDNKSKLSIFSFHPFINGIQV